MVWMVRSVSLYRCSWKHQCYLWWCLFPYCSIHACTIYCSYDKFRFCVWCTLCAGATLLGDGRFRFQIRLAYSCSYFILCSSLFCWKLVGEIAEKEIINQSTIKHSINFFFWKLVVKIVETGCFLQLSFLLLALKLCLLCQFQVPLDMDLVGTS